MVWNLTESGFGVALNHHHGQYDAGQFTNYLAEDVFDILSFINLEQVLVWFLKVLV